MALVRGPFTLNEDVNGKLTRFLVYCINLQLIPPLYDNDDGAFWCCITTCAGNVLPEKDPAGWYDKEDKVDPAQQALLNKLIRHSLVNNRNEVEVLQRDPTSPLYSVKTFEELRL